MANVNVQKNVSLSDLRDELAAAMQESLEYSKLTHLIKEYGLEDVVKFEMSVNKEKIQTKQNIEIDEQTMSSLQDASDENFGILACAFCPKLTCCDYVANPCAGCP